MQNYSEILDKVQAGQLRAAKKNSNGQWETNTVVKEAILASFKAGKNIEYNGIYSGFVDKNTLKPRHFKEEDQVRMVPGGSSVRRGAYVAPGVIIMPPAYINIGAFVDSGSMVDSHALVGACAQIGKNVHLSAAVQIGGVLEPIGNNPVIIEDDVFIGAGSVIVEGIIIRKGAVIAPGVSISKSVQVYDCVNETKLDISNGIPQNAVVIPGTRPISSPWGKINGLNVSCALIIKYRDTKSNASLELEEALR